MPIYIDNTRIRGNVIFLIGFILCVMWLCWDAGVDAKMDELSKKERLTIYCNTPGHIETLCKK